MKKYFYILTIFALLLASCSSISDDGSDETTIDNSLSFTYKSYRNNTTTYAPTIPALDAEKVVDDMAIFVCSSGQFVRKLALGTDYTETTVGENTTLEITSDFIAEFAGKSVTFYFVPNNTSAVGGTHIDDFTGSQQQFEDLLSTPLADSPYYPAGAKAELIRTKDDFGTQTYGLLMTAKSKDILVAGKRSETITLKRRVARFDVENPAPESYAINEIYVSNAKVQVPMFATSAADHSGIATRSLEEIIGPNESNYGVDKIAPCAFYLYPTDLSTTTIVLEVADLTQNPVKSAYFTLDASKLTNTKIEANMRYVIFFDETTLQVGLRPGDWNNGGGGTP